MRLLILGGTVFLGHHLVEAALTHGHGLTLFNRGKSRPNAFPTVEQIHGDRATDLAQLSGRSWDAVIDTCGYLPGIVRTAAEALHPLAAHYTFISSRGDVELRAGLKPAREAELLAQWREQIKSEELLVVSY